MVEVLLFVACPTSPAIHQYEARAILRLTLEPFWQVAFKHFECLDIKKTYILIIYGMYMGRLMLFWLKEHLYDNSIKSYNLRHVILFSFICLANIL